MALARRKEKQDEPKQIEGFIIALLDPLLPSFLLRHTVKRSGRLTGKKKTGRICYGLSANDGAKWPERESIKLGTSSCVLRAKKRGGGGKKSERSLHS